jgi:hypothetical protein
MSENQKEQYDKALNALGLRRDKDPFPLDPPVSVDYWADNKEVLERMVKTQLDSAMFASSFIYVLYGPVGGGKTFAIKYLANSEVQKTIFKALKKPEIETFSFRVTAIVPLRTGQLTFSLHRNMVESCLAKIREDQDLLKILTTWKDFGVGCIKTAFKDIASHVNRPLGGSLSLPNLETTEGFKFLTQTKSKIGKLNDVNDLVETIRILVYILSKKYSRVVISIDELENLARATGTERFLISDFFRKLHENIEHDLTVFLIFTLDSFEGVADLLQKAFLSRIKDKIEFSYVKSAVTVREYIYECILKRCNVNPYDVIAEDVIYAIADSLISTFRGALSFRTINTEMIKTFTDAHILADRPKKFRIDSALYSKVNKIVLSDEVMRQLTERLGQGGQK